mmetsp:Transcript_151847/g.487269  ORF Transcript_151847/g.487269 Transcript_151847/m.487269 type:complete len:989 (-) Transcript_151847:110-3076(-)
MAMDVRLWPTAPAPGLSFSADASSAAPASQMGPLGAAPPPQGRAERPPLRALPPDQLPPHWADDPDTPMPASRRHPAQMYDSSLMETATLGPWRQTVHQVNRFMSQEQHWVDEHDDPFSMAAGEAPQESSGESDNDAAETRPLGWSVPGMQQLDPELIDWMKARMGTRTKVFLVLSFMVLEGCKTASTEKGYVEGVNLFSIIVVTNLTSLSVALFLSFFLEGPDVAQKIFRFGPLVRFMGISFLFTFASVLVLLAYRIGTPPVEVVTMGYIYMPISAVLSYYVFRRRYGTLEWLSVAMMSLAVLVFVLLREESKDEVSNHSFKLQGFGIVLGAVAISVSASILAERCFKQQDLCMTRHTGQRQTHKFYIMKVHLDFASLVISALLWLSPTFLPRGSADFMEQWSRSRHLFGTWGWDQVKMVIVVVGQGWAAGLITKEFSTVIKAIVQTMAVVLIMLMEDKLMGERFHFAGRQVPSILLAIILVMSAVIFQTGRLNLQTLRKAANIDAEAHPELEMAALAQPESGALPRKTSLRSQEASLGAGGPRGAADSNGYLAAHRVASRVESVASRVGAGKRAAEPQAQAPHTWQGLVQTYALICVYIVSDAGRTIVLQKALQSTVINSTSMGLVCYICGAFVASVLSLQSHGFQDGLVRAWSPAKILHCLPAAFLFALATALSNMAFAQGINSALYVVIGKFYTPVAAIAARWIMGKFYMWLEWFALLILTLASVVFGYLQKFQTDSSGVASGAPLPAMLLVLGSAATSALASLATEKILKGEQVPFHMQKVRLDVGSIMSSLVLLPALGFIATRPQDIPWAERPQDESSCPLLSECWDLGTGGCGSPDCHCDCTSGIFAGWDSSVLLLAVFINTMQGWLVGSVTKQFSVIHRAIADSFSLLAIYFIGDPIFNHTSLSNVGLNLVAFIVPVSTATFSAATSEMQKVFKAKEVLRQFKVWDDHMTDKLDTVSAMASDTESDNASDGSLGRNDSPL